MPYQGFDTGYKKTKLAADELIRTICLVRRFSGHIAYTRKVGARNAQGFPRCALRRWAGAQAA